MEQREVMVGEDMWQNGVLEHRIVFRRGGLRIRVMSSSASSRDKYYLPGTIWVFFFDFVYSLSNLSWTRPTVRFREYVSIAGTIALKTRYSRICSNLLYEVLVVIWTPPHPSTAECSHGSFGLGGTSIYIPTQPSGE